MQSWICSTKEAWLTTLAAKHNTIKSHESVLNLLCSWANQHPSDIVDLSLLKAFVTYLQNDRHIQYATLRGYVAILVRWLAWLGKSEYKQRISEDQLLDPGLVRQELYRLINPPQPRSDGFIPDLRRLPAYYELERRRFRGIDVLNELNTDAKHRRAYLTCMRNRALIVTLFESGSRLSEVLSLLTTQISGSNLRLDDLARKWLDEYLEARKPWYVNVETIFISHGPRADGQRMSADTAERAVKVAALWLAEQRKGEGADPEEVEQLRMVSAESIRRFFSQERQAAANYFTPTADLRDVMPNH